MRLNVNSILLPVTAFFADRLTWIALGIVLTILGIWFYLFKESTIYSPSKKLNSVLSHLYLVLACICFVVAFSATLGCSPREKKLHDTREDSPVVSTSSPDTLRVKQKPPELKSTNQQNSSTNGKIEQAENPAPTPRTAQEDVTLAPREDRVAAANPERRRPAVSRARPRPAPSRCAVTEDDRNTAQRWSQSPGYAAVANAAWLVCEWKETIKTTPIDPALFVWQKGFDSPAMDCPFIVRLQSQEELLDDKGVRWPGIAFEFMGETYYSPIGSDLKAEFTVPCYQSIKNIQYRRAAQATVRLSNE